MEVMSALDVCKQSAERKLRLFLPKAKSIYESVAYHRFAMGLRKEDFREVVVKLHEEGFLEMADGRHLGTVVLVLKSAAAEYMAAEFERRAAAGRIPAE